MSIESKNVDFKRRIHYEANKYLDILTIMQQLEKNGFIDKFYDLLNDVYETEHHFTISELRKIARKAKENQEVFDFMDHYSSNTSIFKQNLSSILEMFVETIWNAKFQKVYQTVHDSSPEAIEELLDPKNTLLNTLAQSKEIEQGRPDLNGYLSSGEPRKQQGILKKPSKKTLDQSSTKAWSEERSKSPPRLENGWEKPTYKYGKESKDSFKSNLHPGPAAYNVQVDRTGGTTFSKKKSRVAPPSEGGPNKFRHSAGKVGLDSRKLN